MAAKPVLIFTHVAELARSLALALEPHGYEAIACADAQKALQQARQGGVDCVVIDWDAGEALGQALMDCFGRSMPRIILASPSTARAAMKQLRAGAADILVKPIDPPELAAAIDEAIPRTARSAKWLEEIEVARRLLPALSPREQQIVAGILAGQTSREIAHAESISVRTVETSRTRLLGKLGVPNTASLVRLAVLASLAPQTGQAAEAEA